MVQGLRDTKTLSLCRIPRAQRLSAMIKFWSWRPLECAGFWQLRPFELTHYCTKILSDDSYSLWSTSFRNSDMSSKSDFEANYYPSKKIAKWVWFTTSKFYFYYVLNSQILDKTLLWRVDSFLYETAKSSFIILFLHIKLKTSKPESLGFNSSFWSPYWGIQICKDILTYIKFLWMRECATHISGFLEWTCAVKP